MNFVKKERETVTHMLITCEVVKKAIWLPLIKWLDYFCYIQMNLDVYEIIFNNYKDSFSTLVNSIIVLTKQYIYATRCLGNKLSFTQLTVKIHDLREIEKMIAKRNGNMVKHTAKWNMYDML